MSTHALQALVMLNSDFAAGRAKALAGRLFREARGSTDARIALAYHVVLARDPKTREVEQARAFLRAQTEFLRDRARDAQPLARVTDVPEEIEPAEAAAWVDFALAMLNRNEFLYVP